MWISYLTDLFVVFFLFIYFWISRFVIFFNFSLPEQYFGKIKKGYRVKAMVDFLQNESFEGIVTAMEPSIDPKTRNFGLQASFENQAEMLRAGMFARIKIELPEKKESVVIPRTAINFNPYGNSVFVLEPVSVDEVDTFVAKSRFIQIGKMEGELISITEGLKEGEIVATSGLLKLQNNMRVKVNNELKPSEEYMPKVENS